MKALKIKKVAALIAAILLLVFLLCLTNTLTGYPVDYFVVKRAAAQYMEETYPNQNLVLSRPERMLKLGGFRIRASSPDDPNLQFHIDFWTDGTLRYDTYEDDVIYKGNLFSMLDEAYHHRCNEVLERHGLPWPVTCSGSFRNAISSDPDSGVEPMDTRRLTEDDQYNLGALSAKHGTLQLMLELSDAAGAEETAVQTLLAAREWMEQAGLPFRCAELWIMPEGQDEYALLIHRFDWDDIYEDGMNQRVRNAIAATDAKN